MGEMHGDFHGGNILAEEMGNLKLLDWGQTTTSKGLLMNPLRLMVSLYTANPKKLSKILLRMGTINKQFSRKDLEKYFKGFVVQNNIAQTSLLKAVIKLKSKSKNETALKATVNQDMAMKVYRELDKKFGFKFNAQYLHLTRSMAPAMRISAEFAKLLRKQDWLVLGKRGINYAKWVPLKYAKYKVIGLENKAINFCSSFLTWGSTNRVN